MENRVLEQAISAGNNASMRSSAEIAASGSVAGAKIGWLMLCWAVLRQSAKSIVMSIDAGRADGPSVRYKLT